MCVKNWQQVQKNRGTNEVPMEDGKVHFKNTDPRGRRKLGGKKQREA